MAKHEIRAADPGDLVAVRAIARAAYAPYVPRIGREPAPMVADFGASLAAGHLWVAGDPVTGFVVAYPRGDHWHLENVAVAPEAQGTGLGRTLVAHVEAMARASGAAAVELYTNVKMTENQALYPRLGYAETRRAAQDGFERVFYRKALSQNAGD
ncbi:MAG TPA: GNAT family N-acetyltransferase [Thermohalobaculum sp.]|nr:GNAT family N-acetyltransferase [Thermohalobaculum sp.]